MTRDERDPRCLKSISESDAQRILELDAQSRECYLTMEALTSRINDMLAAPQVEILSMDTSQFLVIQQEVGTIVSMSGKD